MAFVLTPVASWTFQTLEPKKREAQWQDGRTRSGAIVSSAPLLRRWNKPTVKSKSVLTGRSPAGKVGRSHSSKLCARQST